MNIEDIKKKLREYNAEVVASRGCCDVEDFSLDVAFLVVENEKLKTLLLKSSDNFRTEPYNKEEIEFIAKLRTEASLKAIRGN